MLCLGRELFHSTARILRDLEHLIAKGLQFIIIYISLINCSYSYVHISKGD